MTNLTLANVIENNLGPGAEMLQEVAVRLHSYLSGVSMEGYIHHKLLEIRDVKYNRQ